VGIFASFIDQTRKGSVAPLLEMHDSFEELAESEIERLVAICAMPHH
jgi:hypothetical protein